MGRVKMTLEKIDKNADELKEITQESFNRACEDYAKILNITKTVEDNIYVMGIDYKLNFGVSNYEEIVFNFTRFGIQCTRVRFSLLAFKALQDDFIIEQIMRCLLMDLSDWRDVINTLQQ